MIVDQLVLKVFKVLKVFRVKLDQMEIEVSPVSLVNKALLVSQDLLVLLVLAVPLA